jgi:hypothetical protein
MENVREELKVIEVEKVKSDFLKFAKDILFKKVELNKIRKNDTLLNMFEQGRISRDEYLLLMSNSENVQINITLDNSINAPGGTWGGTIVMGNKYGDSY